MKNILLESPPTVISCTPDSSYNYTNFYKTNISLKSAKLTILKQIAKKNNLKCYGNKKVLFERIHAFFYKHRMTNLIQKNFRGYLVRLLFQKREPFKNCVNETDFYTLEPLSHISAPFLYIYKEDDKIMYGFHLFSLYTLICKSGSPNEIKNPYNRSIIPENIVQDVRTLYRVSNICFPANTIKNEVQHHKTNNVHRITRRRSLTNDLYPTPMMEIYQERVRKLTEIREKSFQNRVSILFTELDYLGNYTREEWFLELMTVDNYLRLYRILFNIWYQHSQMPLDIRQKICMCGDPFENIVAFSSFISIENIQENCLRVFENMIFMGVDDDHRKLGAFHALSALTVVSVNARNAMPWLYESLVAFI